MKNIIPIVVAVVLALAAAFFVSRYFKKASAADTEMISVVAASGNLPAGTTLRAENVRPAQIPVSAYRDQHIKWTEREMLYGQQLSNRVDRDDYILNRDIYVNDRISSVVRNGEWAISVDFANTDIVKFLKPGDEIAVIGSFSVEEKKESMDLNDTEKAAKKRSGTLVVLPKARVMDTTIGSAAQGTSSIIMLALPPQQANLLIAAQQKMALYPALRNKDDKEALSRLDAGVVDEETFEKMLEGLPTVHLPEVPLK